jgi:hypothetical protein
LTTRGWQIAREVGCTAAEHHRHPL